MSDDQVTSIIQRVQRLQEEKRMTEDDIREVYAEARANGFDVKVLRAVVKHLAKDQSEVEEFDAIFDLYLQAFKNGLAGAGAGRATHAHEATKHQPARHLPERDPQSGHNGSNSVGGAGGVSPVSITGSEQESVVEPQARNEPGSEEAASGGERVAPLPETQHPATRNSAAPIDLTIPSFLDRRHKPQAVA